MSLLEVMAALAIIVTMMYMALTSIDNALELRNLLEQRDDTTRAARVAMGTLKRELQLAFLTPHQDAAERYRTLLVGMDDDPDRLYFSSLAHQRLYRDSRESDQTEITVWAEPSRSSRGYVLYHREAPRIDEEPDEGGIVLPLAHDVRSFELRYLDAQRDEWVEEWDTRGTDTPYRLPRAIQIGLVLIGTDPEDPDRTVDLPFLTTVMLEYAEPYNTAPGQQGGGGPSVGPQRGGNLPTVPGGQRRGMTRPRGGRR